MNTLDNDITVQDTPTEASSKQEDDDGNENDNELTI
jgi:hypothetical protein